MKLKALTKAQEYSSIRKHKARQALAAVQVGLRTIEKLKREIHFWHGAEGVQWFMSKNNLSPEVLDEEFNKIDEPAYLDSDETHEITRKITALTETYLKALDDLLQENKLR
jgi:hypothetical protein